MNDSLQRKKKIYTIIYIVSCALIVTMGLADSILTIVAEFATVPTDLQKTLTTVFIFIGVPPLVPLIISCVKLRHIKSLLNAGDTEAPNDNETSDDAQS